MNAPARTTENHIQLLGQGGCILCLEGLKLFVDPYLSNSVQEMDSPDLDRLVEIPIAPEQVTDADWVLITHEHMDHCDPKTIPLIAQASPKAKFLAPAVVLKLLSSWGVETKRLIEAKQEWLVISPSLKIHTVPASHLDVDYDEDGKLLYVGYVIEASKKRIYLAGDTRVADELIDSLENLGPISLAILPVNEHNYFRSRRGIVGNMSPREAFMLANELGFERVVPVHWDMFEVNSASPDEIRAVFAHLAPGFQLLLGQQHIKV